MSDKHIQKGKGKSGDGLGTDWKSVGTAARFGKPSYLSFIVFEHQTISIGETQNGVTFTTAHFQNLLNFHQKKATKFFTPVHNGIKFSHYVGALQTGDLTIEILPKADRDSLPDAKRWQSVLLDLLRECKLMKMESLTHAALRLRPNAILDLYVEIFLKEVEQLLQEGLVKSYQRQEANLPVLKGRLVVPKHIRKNSIQKDRFYVNFEKYDYNHLFNQLIFKGLIILEKIVRQPILVEKLRQIRAIFPKVKEIPVTEKDFDQLKLHHQTQRYATALDIARLLILNYAPDISSGKNHVLAILFDMNLLWEEYIYRQLKKVQNEGFQVSRQQQKPFWQRRYLRPDILVKSTDRNMVIDTKWKVLKKVAPSMEDLRQMYVYNQYFSAEKSVLIYPKVHDLEDLAATPFSQKVDGKTYFCQVNFVDILENGKLNRNIGKQLLRNLNLPNSVNP